LPVDHAHFEQKNLQRIRFMPVKVPDDKVWTAKEDARYISPVIALPGYRHTIGIARVWHFLTVPFFVLNGAITRALTSLTPCSCNK
jgi:methionine sulfoxide reductase catalytic subunit